MPPDQRKSLFLLARTTQAQLNMNPDLESFDISKGQVIPEEMWRPESEGGPGNPPVGALRGALCLNAFSFGGRDRGRGLQQLPAGAGILEGEGVQLQGASTRKPGWDRLLVIEVRISREKMTFEERREWPSCRRRNMIARNQLGIFVNKTSRQSDLGASRRCPRRGMREVATRRACCRRQLGEQASRRGEGLAFPGSSIT